MGDYASKGLANGVGIPALVLGSLGFLGSGGLGGLFGGNGQNVIAEKDSKIAKLEAEKYSDSSNIELYKQIKSELKETIANERATYKEFNSLQERLFKSELEKQSMLTAQGIQGLQAQINCTNNHLNCLQTVVNGITKTIVPKEAICPEYMNRYNSWIAPTTTESA